MSSLVLLSLAWENPGSSLAQQPTLPCERNPALLYKAPAESLIQDLSWQCQICFTRGRVALSDMLPNIDANALLASTRCPHNSHCGN